MLGKRLTQQFGHPSSAPHGARSVGTEADAGRHWRTVKEVIEFANGKEIHQGNLEGGGHVLERPLWKVAPDLLDLENHGEQGGRRVLPPPPPGPPGPGPPRSHALRIRSLPPWRYR